MECTSLGLPKGVINLRGKGNTFSNSHKYTFFANIFYLKTLNHNISTVLRVRSLRVKRLKKYLSLLWKYFSSTEIDYDVATLLATEECRTCGIFFDSQKLHFGIIKKHLKDFLHYPTLVRSQFWLMCPVSADPPQRERPCADPA